MVTSYTPHNHDRQANNGQTDFMLEDGDYTGLNQDTARRYALGMKTYTLDERRRAALEEVDNASFSWFHAKVCLATGVGFFTDAYDLFSINIASTMLALVYYRGATELPFGVDLGLKIAAPVGTLAGQLVFGWLADIYGRKRMYGIELTIIIVGTFAQTLAGNADSVNIFGVLIVWRFIMGIGIGGDYPLSAVITSEFASTRIRGRMMTAVFSLQGWGQFLAALVSIILTAACKHSISNSDPTHPAKVDLMWRILIGIGAVPGAIALYFRLTIPETPRFTMDIERNVKQAAEIVEELLKTDTWTIDPDAPIERAKVPQASRSDFFQYMRKWKNGKILLGTAWSWFALDIAYYGLNNNSTIVLAAIYRIFNYSDSSVLDVYQLLKTVSVGNIILSFGGLIPGYYVAFFLIDSWGRKKLQLTGFALLSIILCIIGFAYPKLAGTKATNSSRSAFLFLYCLANFFQNLGPNTTTFIIPGEIFPTRYRSSAHGISAACGKLGAIIAQVVFSVTREQHKNDSDHALQIVFGIFGLFGFTGILSTLLIPETRQKSLENLSNEVQLGFVSGTAGSVEGSVEGNGLD